MLSSEEGCGVSVMGEITCGAGIKPTASLSDFEQSSRRTVLGCGIEFLCYQGTVSVLSGHPRWMFRKNSMEFFIGLQPYLYYCYSGCTLESHDHMSFPECSMVT